MSRANFFQSYLFAFTFWLELSLGCLALSLAFHIVSGRWSLLIRKALLAGASTLWLMFLFLIPLLFGVTSLFPHLNATALILRTVFYFGLWLTFATIFNRSPENWSGFKMSALGSGGFLLYGFTASFAAIDWLMSLDPHWYSTIFGLLRIGSEALSAMALCIITARILTKTEKQTGPQQWHDLGNLLLTTTMLWAYLSFSQFLIIWAGNLPEEVGWYYNRVHSGWQFEIIALAALRFALPFALLLFRRFKRNPRALALIAALPLVMHFFEVHWLVLPAFSPTRYQLRPLDIVLWLFLGTLWLLFYVFRLRALQEAKQ